MKRILLIGCLNKTSSSIMECLLEDYQVQLCPENPISVRSMVSLIKPDLIIISQIGMVNEDIPIFDIFKSRYLRTPMLIIALEELKNHFDDIAATERNVHSIYRPITKRKVIEACKKLLKTTSANDEEILSTDKFEKNPHNDAVLLADDAHRNILVVDDSLLVLRNVERLLKEKYEVSIAESGNQAIKIMQKTKIDLVLLDYEMPSWDGKKTLEIMRKDPNLKDIPVVFLTGISEREHILSVLQLNPAGYLLKPTNQEKLIETIESVLQKKPTANQEED